LIGGFGVGLSATGSVGSSLRLHVSNHLILFDVS
jgi:hypothetical protein